MTSSDFDHQHLCAVHLVVNQPLSKARIFVNRLRSPLPFLRQEEINSPGRYPFKISYFRRPQSLTFFVVLSSNPETTKPPTFRRSSPIRKPAVHPVNCPLSVSDRPLFAALSSTIDSVFPSVCQLPFQLPLRPDTLLCVFSTALLPRSILCHLLCVDCLFFNCRCAQTLSSLSVCRLRLFNFRCAFVFNFQLGHRHLGEVPRYSAFTHFLRRFLIVQAKQRLL